MCVLVRSTYPPINATDVQFKDLPIPSLPPNVTIGHASHPSPARSFFWFFFSPFPSLSSTHDNENETENDATDVRAAAPRKLPPAGHPRAVSPIRARVEKGQGRSGAMHQELCGEGHAGCRHGRCERKQGRRTVGQHAGAFTNRRLAVPGCACGGARCGWEEEFELETYEETTESRLGTCSEMNTDGQRTWLARRG